MSDRQLIVSTERNLPVRTRPIRATASEVNERPLSDKSRDLLNDWHGSGADTPSNVMPRVPTPCIARQTSVVLRRLPDRPNIQDVCAGGVLNAELFK